MRFTKTTGKELVLMTTLVGFWIFIYRYFLITVFGWVTDFILVFAMGWISKLIWDLATDEIEFKGGD